MPTSAPGGPGPATVPELRSFGFAVIQATGVRAGRIGGEGIDAGTPADPGGGGPGLTVRFDDAGVSVGPGWDPRPVTPWSEVRRVAIGHPGDGPAGRPVTPIEIETGTGTMRLAAEGDRRASVPLAALEHCLRWWSPVVAPSVPPRTGRRRPAGGRRVGLLVGGLALILSGLGLAVGLGRHAAVGPKADAPAAAPSPADEHLAERIMLTQADLPVGWTVEPDPAGSGASSSPGDQTAITRAFAGCMGVGDRQATVLLGGASADQTAQSTSPIFVSPTSPADQGYTVQLQTAASVVRTHGDEESDLRALASHRYPGCAAAAIASELQIAVDDASGAHGVPGPATGTLVAVPHAPGEQVTALRVACQVSDHGTPVTVVVDAVILGTDRIEADLQAFAIGGPVTGTVLQDSLQAFEERVADRGQGVQI